MNWNKTAKNNDIVKRIKGILKSHSFTKKLMADYKIPVEDIDNNLEIIIEELDGKFAEGNGKKIFLDKKLFEKDFFKENFHFLIHEFFHWIKRRCEKDFYFNDPEELQSFTLAICWELLNNKDIDKTIYPIIKSHFKDEFQSRKVFNKMVERAKDIIENL